MHSYDFDDDTSNELDIGLETTKNKKTDLFTIINANARSLCPKMNSFIDTFKEMESSLAIVTETWLKSGEGLEDDLDDLLHGAGIGLITLNRRAGSRGVAHGGVAIGYRAAVMDALSLIHI